jgi:hypothetical protein
MLSHRGADDEREVKVAIYNSNRPDIKEEDLVGSAVVNMKDLVATAFYPNNVPMETTLVNLENDQAGEMLKQENSRVLMGVEIAVLGQHKQHGEPQFDPAYVTMHLTRFQQLNDTHEIGRAVDELRVGSLQSKVESLEKANKAQTSRFEGRLTGHEEDTARLGSELQQHKEANERLVTESRVLEADKLALVAKVVEHQSALRRQQDELEERQQRLEQLVANLGQEKARKAEMEAEVHALHAEKQALKTAFDGIHALNDHYQDLVEDPEDCVEIFFHGAKMMEVDSEAVGHVELRFAARFRYNP